MGLLTASQMKRISKGYAKIAEVIWGEQVVKLMKKYIKTAPKLAKMTIYRSESSYKTLGRILC